MLRSGQPEPPDPSTLDVRRVLLASEGREIPPRAIEFAVRIAGRSQAPVHVFSVARVYGTSFGFPNPGLLPTRHEWAEQRRLVGAAVKALKKHGLEASGHVVGTRKATKRIVQEAERRAPRAAEAVEVEAHRGGHERPRQRAATRLVGPGHEPDAELTIVCE